jgi:hypothetical protein
VLVKLFYTCMCFLCNSRFKSSLELMLCVIDISTLNKTYLIWFGTPFVSLPHKWLAWISVITSAFFLQTIACYTDWSRRIKITLRYKMILTTLKSGIQHGAWVSMWPNVTYSVSRNQQHTSIDLTTLYLKKSTTYFYRLNNTILKEVENNPYLVSQYQTIWNGLIT